MADEVCKDLGSTTSAEARRCPVQFFGRLLDKAPVYKDPVTGAFVVSRFADIAWVSDHPKIFLNFNEQLIGRSGSPAAQEVQRRFRENGFPEVHTLVTADAPHHARYRKIVEKIFSPSFVRTLEPRIHAIANQLIDDFEGRGEIYFQDDFAVLLPMYIIVDRLGLPRADWKKIKRWSDVSVARVDPTQSVEQELALTDEFIEMQNYLHKHIEFYRQSPADNLLSAIAIAVDDTGEPLSDADAVSIAHQLMVAGNETTTTVMLAALNEILTRPGLKEKVLGDFTILPGLIEETLRMHTPVPMFYRTVAEDTSIGDVAIAKGSLVCISYLGGNHDPQKWEAPEDFQVSRAGARQHLSFGRGAHYCIGHLVAKAELRIALELLLRRLPNLRLSADHAAPAFVEHPFIHSLGPMHLQFDHEAEVG